MIANLGERLDDSQNLSESDSVSQSECMIANLGEIQSKSESDSE